jgi:hypothetical protein
MSRGVAVNSFDEDPDLVRQYLLGVLTEEQSQHLEERLLTSSALREELLVVEDELIDEYLSGELSEAEKEHFATRFLQAPERQQNLRFAKTLEQYVAAAEVPEIREISKPDFQSPSIPSSLHRLFSMSSPVLNWSLVAVLVLSVLVGVWAIIKLKGTDTRQNSLAVRLEPGLVRGESEIEKFSVPANIQTVQLQLVAPPNDYRRYRVVLESSIGGHVWTGDNLTANTFEGRSYINCDIPSSVLRPDDYKVTLSGYSSKATFDYLTRYSFRILK